MTRVILLRGARLLLEFTAKQGSIQLLSTRKHF